MKHGTIWMLGLAACALVAAVGVACGDDDDGVTPAPATPTSAAATPSGGDETVVEVLLNEFSVLPDKNSVPAGEVVFQATNEGPDDEHEFVIIRTDLAADALPTAADGSVIEEEVDVVDEIEGLPVGETEEVTVDLEAGSYVLICNIVEEEDGETESHYQLGMRRALTVE
ncbi:MAG: hypothetical protein WEC75_11405 [Dehalococcoidia bacterium]